LCFSLQHPKTTPVQAHFRLDDDTFERQFDTAVLPDELFTHEAHLRLAWIQLERNTPTKAAAKVCTQIQNYASSLGQAGKFHKTLTTASVYVVAHFKEKSKCTSFKDVLTEFPQLNSRFKELLLSHYSQNELHSDKARIKYQEPDLIPFN